MNRQPQSMTELRRLLVADSIERKRWMDRLIQLVRVEEREKTITTIARARDNGREA